MEFLIIKLPILLGDDAAAKRILEVRAEGEILQVYQEKSLKEPFVIAEVLRGRKRIRGMFNQVAALKYLLKRML